MTTDGKFSDYIIRRESNAHHRAFSSKLQIAFISLIVLGMVPFAGECSNRASQPILASPNPPTAGDWIIGASEAYINHSRTIMLNGSLVIENGGSLTLDNVTLLMNSPTGFHYNITVRNGGTLTIKGNSNVTAMNPEDEWYLSAYPGSTIYFENSIFSYAGYWGGTDIEQDIGIFSGLWFNTTNMEVTNCTIQDNWVGLAFFQAANGMVCSNTIKNCWQGIRLGAQSGSTGYPGAFNISVIGNRILDCAIGVYDSSWCNISGNEIANSPDSIGQSSLFMINSSSALISNNSFTNSTLQIWSSSNLMITQNTITNVSRYGGISLSGVSISTIISNNTIVNTGDAGITLSSTSNILIEKNDINNCGMDEDYHGAGIDIFSSNSSTVHGNHITNCNEYGIRILGSNNGFVTSNIITGTKEIGIFLWPHSGNNSLWGNALTSNKVNAWDDSPLNNQWDNGTHGNYWDDHSGLDMNHDGIYDAPYEVPLSDIHYSDYWNRSEVPAQDRYPLMLPLGADTTPPTIDSPADLELAEGDRGAKITWSPSDVNAYWYEILDNDTVIRDKSWDGALIIISLDSIVETPGSHNITIVVYDRAGHFATDTVFVIVIAEAKETSEESKSKTTPGFPFLMLLSLGGLVLGRPKRCRQRRLN